MAREINSICLVKFHNGDEVESVYIPLSEFTLGRGEDADIQINSSSASRKHFRINVKGRGLWIMDLGSSNGTLVSGRSLEANMQFPYPLGERIRFGDKNLSISIQLYQLPLTKFDQAEEIVHEAFEKAALTEELSLKKAAELKHLAEQEIAKEKSEIKSWRIEVESSLQSKIKAKLQEAEERAKKMLDNAESEVRKAMATAESRSLQLEADLTKGAQSKADSILSSALQEGQEILNEARSKGNQELQEIRMEAAKLKLETTKALAAQSEKATKKVESIMLEAESRANLRAEEIERRTLQELKFQVNDIIETETAKARGDGLFEKQKLIDEGTQLKEEKLKEVADYLASAEKALHLKMQMQLEMEESNAKAHHLRIEDEARAEARRIIVEAEGQNEAIRAEFARETAILESEKLALRDVITTLKSSKEKIETEIVDIKKKQNESLEQHRATAEKLRAIENEEVVRRNSFAKLEQSISAKTRDLEKKLDSTKQSLEENLALLNSTKQEHAETTTSHKELAKLNMALNEDNTRLKDLGRQAEEKIKATSVRQSELDGEIKATMIQAKEAMAKEKLGWQADFDRLKDEAEKKAKVIIDEANRNAQRVIEQTSVIAQKAQDAQELELAELFLKEKQKIAAMGSKFISEMVTKGDAKADELSRDLQNLLIPRIKASLRQEGGADHDWNAEFSKLLKEKMSEVYGQVEQEVVVDDQVEQRGLSRFKRIRHQQHFLMGLCALILISAVAYPQFYASLNPVSLWDKSGQTASEAYIKKKKELRGDFLKFEPEQSPSYKETYVDNILYTTDYFKKRTEKDVQDRWTRALNGFLLQDLNFKDNNFVDFMVLETDLIEKLQDIRKDINPRYKDKAIQQMTDLEASVVSKMKDLLGSEINYKTFKEFEISYFANTVFYDENSATEGLKDRGPATKKTSPPPAE